MPRRSLGFAMRDAAGYWWLKYLMIVSIATVLFTSVPSVLIYEEVVLPPAYELKAQHPLADTSNLTIPRQLGEKSHGAKLTPRLAGSLLLYWAKKLSLHPYLPATLFGIIFLFSGIWIGYQVTGDRLIGLFVGMTFAGLSAAAASFSIVGTPKPFDGVAIGLLGMTMISARRHWLLAILSFLSCWTDERAIISLFFIACLVIAWPAFDSRAALSRCLTIAGAVGAYLVTRLALSAVLGWGTPDFSYVGVPPGALLFSPLAVWSCFEGGLIAIVMAVLVLCKHRDYAGLFLLVGSIVVAVVPCVLVLDLSRTSSFAFPVIPMCYALLKRHGATTHELRSLAGTAGVISLLAPNFKIITGITVQWVPSFLPGLFGDGPWSTELFKMG